MATKINSIISQAHELAQLTSSLFSDEPSGTQSAASLLALNNILQQFNEDQLIPFSKMKISYNIVESKQYYTFGVDSDDPLNLADIQYERPAFIGTVLYRTSATSNPFRILPVTLEDVCANTIVSTNGVPRYFATNNTYPLSELHFNMKPQAGSIIDIIYNKSIPVYGENDTLALPSSMHDLLVTALARRIAINANDQLTGRINALYNESLQRVRIANSRNQIPLNAFDNAFDPLFGYDRLMSGGR